ncbi:MAG: hypothetical protein ACREFI_00180 [Stellaceae bacterium]
MTHGNSAMLEALRAAEPSAAHADNLRLYGQFVGSWSLDIDYREIDGPVRRAEGEWHFDWVLEGRAIQDVWIFPSREARAGDRGAEAWHFYGSTVRVYDPSIDAWHITFFEPTRPFEIRQLGRAVGADIVQMGEEVNGITRRWRFVEITNRSFKWLGEASHDKGATWALEMEMRARRVS